MPTFEFERKDLDKILDEVEKKLQNYKRKSIRTRGTDDRGRNYLDVEIHGEKFRLEADDFGQHIRIYRYATEGLYKFEFIDSCDTANSICYRLAVW